MRNLLWRELMSAARWPGAWALRWAGPVALLFLLGLLVALGRWTPGQSGGFLFHLLGKLSVLIVWVMVPVLTADTIARERREGTLGLLWLTPLKPGEVVMAKLGVHALRAVIVSGASVPVLLLPILVGGVGWPDVARLAAAHLASMGLALSAGLLASSWWRGWWAVRIGAVLLTGAALVVLVGVWTFSGVVTEWSRSGGGGEVLVLRFLRRMRWWLWMQRFEFLEGGMSGMVTSSWGTVGRMSGVALAMIGLAAGVGRLTIWRLGRSIRRDAQGMEKWRRDGWWDRWGGRVVGRGMTAAGALFLLGAWVDWPTVDHVRDLGGLAWVLGTGIAALLGATRLRGFWGSGHAELMAVIPGGHGSWVRREMQIVWERLWPAMILVLGGHGVALIAVLTVRAAVVPWWLGWQIAGAMWAMGTSVWAAAWMAAALAYRRSPRMGFFAVLVWVWGFGPLLAIAVGVGMEQVKTMGGWEYPQALYEVWRSSRLPWMRMRIGSAATGWLVEMVLTAVGGLVARFWLLNRAGTQR